MNIASGSTWLPGRIRPFASLLGVARVRFSLRELLLVMLTCAALAAWLREVVERNPPYRPTKMAEYFSLRLPEDVSAVQTALGGDGNAVLTQAQASPPLPMDHMGEANGGKSAHRHWFCKVRLPWSERRKFLDDLNGRIQSHLYIGRADEPIWNWEQVAEVSFADPDHFGAFTRYHCGDIQGIIRFYVVRTGEGTAHLFATLDEQL